MTSCGTLDTCYQYLARRLRLPVHQVHKRRRFFQSRRNLAAADSKLLPVPGQKDSLTTEDASTHQYCNKIAAATFRLCQSPTNQTPHRRAPVETPRAHFHVLLPIRVGNLRSCVRVDPRGGIAVSALVVSRHHGHDGRPLCSLAGPAN